MANYLTVGASGADYTTLQGALDWLKSNHNYGVDGFAKVTIIDAGTYTFSSTYDVNLLGTASSTAYLEITSNATDPYSGPTIDCTQTSNAALNIWDDYTYIHNLQFQLNNTNSSTECIRLAIDGVSEVLISRCVFIALNQSNDQDAIYGGAISCTGIIDHCPFVGFSRACINSQIFSGTSRTHTWYIDHCSAASYTSGSENLGGFFSVDRRQSTAVINVYAYNNVAYEYNSAGSSDVWNEYLTAATVNYTGSHNVVDDASAEAKFTSSHDSVTFTETEPSSGENAWLKEIDTATETDIDLDIAGVNTYTVLDGTDRTGLEYDARQDFSTDIMGRTRAATPDIGAFEYVATGETITVTAGSITLTGAAVDLNEIENIGVDAGSITLTGAAVDLNEIENVEVTAGVLALAGATVDLNEIENIGVDAGSITLTGAAVDLNEIENVEVDAGSIALNGATVDAHVSEKIDVDAGLVALTGAIVGVIGPEEIAIVAGTIQLNGATVGVDFVPVSGVWVDETAASSVWTDEAAASAVWTDVSDAGTTWFDA